MTAGTVFEKFISNCEIGDPTPEEKPPAFPLVNEATQLNDVFTTFEFKTILVFDIEQISSFGAGTVVKTGIGFTVTGIVFIILVHPPKVALTE